MSSQPPDGLPILVEVLLPGQVAFRTTNDFPHGGGGGLRDEDWEILERDVREAVLKGLQSRLDLILEQRVKETISHVLDHALSGLSAEIKATMNVTLKEVVTRAVTQEVSRIRATKVR